MRRWALLAGAGLALAAGLAGLRVRDALAADECRGLQVCLPVAGPWVVIPAKTGARPARVEFEIRCPLAGYIVAGTDVRLSDPDIDVALRGETGSPVGPGVTTSRSVLFVATYVGPRSAPTTFRPFIGCVPTSGGGGRALTSATGLAPTRPVTRRVAEKRAFAGATGRAVARCRGRERAVDAGHAIAFRTSLPPGRSLIASVRATSRLAADRAVATVTARSGLPVEVRAFVQVIAHCRKDAP